MKNKKTKILLISGLFLAPVGIISSQFNKSFGAAILGASITLIIVHILQNFKFK
jgi:hypothetical protein